MKKTVKNIFAVILAVIMILTFSACNLSQKLGFTGDSQDELAPASSVAMSVEEARQFTNKVPVHLYFVDGTGQRLQMEVRYVPIGEAKKSVNNLASIIVKELIQGPKIGGLKATIPTGTALRSTVAIDSGIATVDLSKEFVANHPGGKLAEQLTLYSIANSLTELKEVQKVKFKINGVVEKNFKGNFRLDSVYTRNTSIINKGPQPTMQLQQSTALLK